MSPGGGYQMLQDVKAGTPEEMLMFFRVLCWTFRMLEVWVF